MTKNKKTKEDSLNSAVIVLIVLIIFLIIAFIQNGILTGKAVQEADKIILIENCGEETLIYDFGNQCWQESQMPGTANNWQDADSYCQNLTLANHSDWRLPTLEELWSIKNYMETESDLFRESHFWSSTKLKENVYWYINFKINYKGYVSDSRAGYGVRCLRTNYY